MVCEIAEGWLCVGVDESFGACYDDGVWGGEEVVNEADGKPPLLFGRFAQVGRPRLTQPGHDGLGCLH